MDTYEFKVKQIGDTRKWEDILPHSRVSTNSRQNAEDVAKGFANWNHVLEVRMELLGSSGGGKYFGKTVKKALRHRECLNSMKRYRSAKTKTEQDQALKDIYKAIGNKGEGDTVASQL